MKIDFKMVIIISLVLVTGLLGGYVLGQMKKAPVQPVPVSKQVAKEYKDSVAKVIREHAEEIQKCYVDFLASGPVKTEGTVDIVMKVLESGKLESFEIIGNGLENDELSECIVKSGKKWRLPPPPLGLNPHIPHSFAFKSEETMKREALERQKMFPEVLPGAP